MRKLIKKIILWALKDEIDMQHSINTHITDVLDKNTDTLNDDVKSMGKVVGILDELVKAMKQHNLL